MTAAKLGASLTPLEVDTLRLLAQGLKQKVIADRQSVANDSVRERLKRIYIKLGATNGPHAVALAMRKGLIE